MCNRHPVVNVHMWPTSAQFKCVGAGTIAEAFMTRTRQQWRTRTSWNEVCQRAAGRRKYNQWQHAMAAARQDEVFKLLLAHGWHTWGVLTKIAAILGCHKSTITRDKRAIERAMLGR